MTPMADTDYDEVVEGTIDEVKEAVQENDLDLEKVLEAEKSNKDRVTLVEWLEEQMEEADTETETTAQTVTSESAGGSLVDRVLRGATSHLFIAGLVIGVAVALAVGPAGTGGAGGMSAAAVGDSVETYFAENSDGVPLESMEVQQVQRLEGSDLYQLDMVLSAQFLNRTVRQNQSAVVTPNGRYIFLSQPIDTERPLAEQIGAAAQQQPQQQQQ
ncbi:MAG: hypothetical protein ABEI97_04300 [Candidatus Nanohaloarchaea archaeon]